MLRLTVTGEAGTIYNGVTDWLYEEEILGQSPALFVSPLATRLAYMSFNDSNVELHSMKTFSQGRNQKGRDLKFRYPKAGTSNPVVSVYIQNLMDNRVSENMKVRPPPEVENM